MKARSKHSSIARHPGHISLGSPLIVMGLVACGAEPEASSPSSEAPLERAQQPIIGGAHANSEELNHTGALVSTLPGGETQHFCTGMLIGPETVVTAKHCARPIPMMISTGGPVFFSIGPDAAAPVERIPVAWLDTAPGDAGGFVENGRDVAVLHLEYPSTLTPATPKSLVGDWVGAPMMSIGYGVHNTQGLIDTQRRIGPSTIAAVEGRTLEAMFGSFEEFLAPNTTESLADDLETLALLHRVYENTVLYDQHEAVVGVASTDVQPCNGDSGGPLARFTVADGWVTYGVASGAASSTRSTCDHGAVYSTFGPETLEFLEEQMGWVDPCGDVPSTGECNGNVARRCYTNFGANIRRIVEDDCTASGQECTASEAGAGCGGVSATELPSPEAHERLVEALTRAARPATVLDLVRSRLVRTQ